MRRPVLLSTCALTVVTAAVPFAAPASADGVPNSEFTIATGANDGSATVAVSEDGTAHVVWSVADSPNAYRVRYCRVPRGTRACAETPVEFGVDSDGGRMIGPPDVFVRGNDVSILSPEGLEDVASQNRLALVQSHDGGDSFGAREAIGDISYSYSRHQGQAPDGSFWTVGSEVQRSQPGSFATNRGSLAEGNAVDSDVVFEPDGTAFATFTASNGDDRVYRLAAGTDPNTTQGWQLAYDLPNEGAQLTAGPLGVLLRSQTPNGSPYYEQIQHWDGSSFSATLVVPFAGGGNNGPMWQDAGGHLFLNFSKQLITNTATGFKLLLHTDRNNYDSGDTAADGGGFLATSAGGSVALLPIPATRRVFTQKITNDVLKAVISNGHKAQVVRLEIRKSGEWKRVTTGRIGSNRTVSFHLDKNGTYRLTAPVIEGYSGFKGKGKSYKA